MNQRTPMPQITSIAEARMEPLPRRIRVVTVLIAISQAIAWHFAPAWAEGVERNVENPPLLEQSKTEARIGLTTTQPTEQQKGHEREFNLNIVYTESKLYNPSTGKHDKVKLRSYVGTDTDPKRPYVAPTIEVAPGDTARITLHNKLPDELSCLYWPKDINTPHCFNGTNLHTHGLWVSPTGNSDNVLLKINPGVSFQYEYNIPPDHPAGTFWYHSHLHGSTALQVSSGMAGALIVRGNRLPTENTQGDIDTLLKRRDGQPMTERILVLQQIQYACLDANGAIKVEQDAKGNVVAWPCDADDVGGIELYDDPGNHGLFGPGTWGQSGRFTSINGIIRPFFITKAGEIERWRMIHAGVRETIKLEFRQAKSGSFPSIDRLKGADAHRFINEHCTGAPIPYHVIADDGLTRESAWPTHQITLQPGYRSDALVVFPEAGTYCVIDAEAPATATVSQTAKSRQLLGLVRAFSGTPVKNIHTYVTKELVAAAEQTIPMPVRTKVITDLTNGLKLSSFTPHQDIRDSEITGTQELTFFIDVSTPSTKFEVSNGLGTFFKPFDPASYDPNRIDRSLILGNADEWILQSRFVSHPFHIHVNPFQIVKILDPFGKDVSGPDAVDGAGGCVDPQYRGLKGVWKDTLWVKSLIGFSTCNTNPGSGIYTLVVRSRYQRYIGEYVLHCHILDHEDQGMMQNVRIVLPGGQSDAVIGGHP